MTTIADKLSAIKNCKTDIASAIEAKGVSVAGASFSDYASLIGQIASSAGSDRIFQCPIASRDAIDLAAALPFPLIIDGHTFSDQESVLLLGQPTGNNGLYQYTIDGESGSLIRLEDDIQNRNLVFITSGSFIRHVFSNAADADVYVDISEGVADVALATPEMAGLVKPDGTTITVDADGTIHAAAKDTGIPVFDGMVTGTVPAPESASSNQLLGSDGKWKEIGVKPYQWIDDNVGSPIDMTWDENGVYLLPHMANNSFPGISRADGLGITCEKGTLRLLPATNVSIGGVKPDINSMSVNDGILSVKTEDSIVAGSTRPVSTNAVYNAINHSSAKIGLDNVGECTGFHGYQTNVAITGDTLDLQSNTPNSSNLNTTGTVTIKSYSYENELDREFSLGFTATGTTTIVWPPNLIWIDKSGAPPAWGAAGAKLVVIIWIKNGLVMASTIYNSEVV